MTAADCPDPARQLRAALSDLVTERAGRRTVPTVLHLGEPGGGQRTFAADTGCEAGLRADVLERALDAFPLDPAPTAWLTRDGDLSPGDDDYTWLAAATDAFGRHGLRLVTFVVMTRSGWFDLLSDDPPVECRVRPRRRGRATSPAVYRLVAVHPRPVLLKDLAQSF